MTILADERVLSTPGFPQRLSRRREAALEAHELGLVAVHDHALRHPASRADRRTIVGRRLGFAVFRHR